MDDAAMPMTMTMINNGALNFQFALIKLPHTRTHANVCCYRRYLLLQYQQQHTHTQNFLEIALKMIIIGGN